MLCPKKPHGIWSNRALAPAQDVKVTKFVYKCALALAATPIAPSVTAADTDIIYVTVPVISFNTAAPVTVRPTPTSTITATLTGTSQSIVSVTDSMTVSLSSRAGGSTIDGIHIVHFSSTDPAVTLPTDLVISPGGLARQTFFVRFATPGIQALIATDAATGAVIGQEIVVVNARQVTPAASLKVLHSAAARQARASWFFAGFMEFATSVTGLSDLASPLETRKGRATAVSQFASMAEFRQIATGHTATLVTKGVANQSVTVHHSWKGTTVVTGANSHPAARVASHLVGSTSH